MTNQGDTAVTGDESCTLNTYVSKPPVGLSDLLIRTQVLDLPCSQSARARLPRNDQTSGDVISDTATLYDGNTQWDNQLAGLQYGDVTETDRVTGYTAGGDPSGWQQVTANRYGDPLGRVTKMFDADNHETDVAYTPAGPGVMTKTTVTNPKGQATATTFEPAWSYPLTLTDPNNNVTQFAYDGLGRTVDVWRPNMPGGSGNPASITYDYHVSQTDTNWQSTTTPAYDGSGTNTSYAFYDAFTRQIQTQNPSPTGHVLVNETDYDQRGDAIRTFGELRSRRAAPATIDTGRPRTRARRARLHVRRGRQADPRHAGLIREHAVVQRSTDYEGDSIGQTAPVGGTAYPASTPMPSDASPRAASTAAPSPPAAASG